MRHRLEDLRPCLILRLDGFFHYHPFLLYLAI
jgi:hypothetical protein